MGDRDGAPGGSDLTRRAVLKRGVFVAGSAVWVVPAVQALSVSSASAEAPSGKEKEKEKEKEK